MERPTRLAGVGVVFCNLCSPGKVVSNITIGYQHGVLQAIEHIVALGHHRVAVIAGPETNRTAVHIKQALVTGLNRRGIRPFPIVSADYHLDAGTSAVRAILSVYEIPTVIFCESDLIAMGAMSALGGCGSIDTRRRFYHRNRRYILCLSGSPAAHNH